MRAVVLASYVAGAYGACDAADQAALTKMGAGSADGSFPAASSKCAKSSLSFTGISESKFNNCLTEASGAKEACTDCYWQAAQYGYKNCKWDCLTSWCGKSCLDCNKANLDAVTACAGFVAPQPAECDAEAFAMEEDAEWSAFKLLNSRQYTSLEHEKARYAIFKSNVEKMKAHNAKGSTYEMGVNEFSDLTADEFAQAHFGFKKPSEMWPGVKKLGTHRAQVGEALSSSVDWTTKGAVTPVKNQGQCGSCWSFSTTGALEGAWELATGHLVSVSEQQFVDCSKQNSGCSGGLMDYAFSFAEGVSLCTEDSYPYKAADRTCSPGGCSVAIPKGGVTGFTDVDHTAQALMSAVSQQPVSVAIEADKSAFQSYTSGVLQGNCGTNLDHGVLCVGYGTDNGVDYWKVKNSWGGSWGEAGYVRMLRGKGGDGECGILESASYPSVNGNAPPSPAPSPSPAQCSSISYGYCCNMGTPCDCSESRTAAGQCGFVAYEYCCNVGTPCDCSAVEGFESRVAQLVV